jgi:type II secretory pathway pseudopilin PulG
MNLKNKQKGVSLIGIIAALVVLGFLLSAVYRYQIYVSESNRANELVRAIRMIKEEALSIAGVEGEVNYFEILEANGGTPKGFVPDRSVGRWDSKWGKVPIRGLIWSALHPAGFDQDDGFILAFPQVPSDICLQTIQSIESEFDLIWWVRSDVDIVIKNYDTPYDRSRAVNACHKQVGIDTGVLRLAVYK